MLLTNEEKQDVIMSLDIGVNYIGITILHNDNSPYGEILELTHVNPRVPNKLKGIEALFLKKKIFKEEFLEKWKNKGITRVVIEAPMITLHNQELCTTLLQYTGMLSDCIYETLGVVPNFISSYDARQYAFPELMGVRKYNQHGELCSKDKIFSNLQKNNLVLFGGYPWDIDKKNLLHSKVAELFPQINWLYDKNGELKQENFNTADSFIAALGFLNKERYGDLNFQISNVEKHENGFSYNLTYWNKTFKKDISFL